MSSSRDSHRTSDPWAQLSRTLRKLKVTAKGRPNVKVTSKLSDASKPAALKPSNVQPTQVTASVAVAPSAVAFPRRVPLVHEQATREAFERITGKRFPKVRPRFLRNASTGRNLELDGYCEELKMAFEYDGDLHSTFPNSFHRTHAQFVAQQQRDILKEKLCRQANIRLFRVASDVALKDIFSCVKSLLQPPNTQLT
jgi:hypothetical protein